MLSGVLKKNRNILCAQGLLKWCNTVMTEYINLENSGNDKGGDQKGKICRLSILLQLPPLLLLNYSICIIQGKFEVNQKTLCAGTLSK